MDDSTGHQEYQVVMFFEPQASTQNSVHHDAECVPLHHDGPAQEEQRSFDELQKKYSSSRCHLHKVDLRGAGSSLQSAIKADERAGLLASTDNERSITGTSSIAREMARVREKHGKVRGGVAARCSGSAAVSRPLQPVVRHLTASSRKRLIATPLRKNNHGTGDILCRDPVEPLRFRT